MIIVLEVCATHKQVHIYVCTYTLGTYLHMYIYQLIIRCLLPSIMSKRNQPVCGLVWSFGVRERRERVHRSVPISSGTLHFYLMWDAISSWPKPYQFGLRTRVVGSRMTRLGAQSKVQLPGANGTWPDSWILVNIMGWLDAKSHPSAYFWTYAKGTCF